MARLLVTVIIATYGRPRLLDRAIRSVLAQTHREFELIVVDDATPGSPAREVVEGFPDPRVRFIRRLANGGPSAARNAAIALAKGGLVTFLDDDDEYYPHCLERFVAALAGAPPGNAFAWCAWDVMDETLADLRIVPYSWAPEVEPEKGLYHAYLKNPRPPTGAFAVHRELLERVGGFDEGIRAAVDVDLLLRMVGVGTPVCVPEALFLKHQHSGPQLTDEAGGRVRAFAMERIFAKHAAAIAEHPELGAIWHRKIAFQYLYAGDTPRAGGHAIRLLLADPRPRRVRQVGAILARCLGIEAARLRRAAGFGAPAARGSPGRGSPPL